jgi:two-component sensor histidine kinase
MQRKVLQRIESLRLATAENMVRLRAAIEASQRRIDAIMAAAREQIAGNSPYNANGRVNGHAAAYGTSFRA